VRSRVQAPRAAAAGELSRSPALVFTMYLRDLQMEPSPATELPPVLSWPRVRASMWAVAVGYLAQVPRRKVVLGGASKINVMVGPRPAVGIFSHSDFGIYPDGIGWIWMQSFDFTVLCEADLQGQQLSLLNVLHDALLEVARRTDSDTQPFVQAKQALLTHPFPLPELRWHELWAHWGLLPKKRRGKRKVEN
jgi:hypothetical protein